MGKTVFCVKGGIKISVDVLPVEAIVASVENALYKPVITVHATGLLTNL